MNILFFISAAIAIFSTFMVITRKNGVNALLYMVVSFLAIALVFYTLGAPFIAVLEVIIYAGAIMVLFIFAIFMLNMGKERVALEKSWLRPSMWIGPSVLAIILLAELIYAFSPAGEAYLGSESVDPRTVGQSLFSSYLIGVEISAFLLMAGIVGAYHLGKTKKSVIHRFLKQEEGGHE